ncbi:MAG: hypothetical protein KDB07_06685, partial [Planctomycetes bacterium]|nr:hypothetical protein [Planctomycetota bacterium]
MRCLVTFLLLVLVAAPLSAQVVADYKEQGNFHGTRNMTARYTPPTPPAVSVPNPTAFNELWADSIQNDRWLLTTWADIEITGATSATVHYFWRAYDKVSGYHTNYVSTANMIGNFDVAGVEFDQISVDFGVGAQLTVNTFRGFRPSISFTKGDGSANSYDGAVIAYTGLDVFNNNIDILTIWLRLDPNTLPPMSTQPEWIQDQNRQIFNVSSSDGNSDYPNVDTLDNGDVMVTWRDFTTATTSTIGGRPGIFPQQPGTNPSQLPAADVYSRRLQQIYQPTNIGPGAMDGA